ncbi:MAG: hypothetical protein IK048_00880 [Clostridia bacterium]|nr:hypothetical protein [Clostridia bacterium]
MWSIIALILVEIVLILLFAPVKIGLKGYFSMLGASAGIDVKIFAFTALRIRLSKKDGKFLLKINDKSPSELRLRPNFEIAKKVAKYLAQGNLRVGGNFLAVFGDMDSKNCAIASGMANAVVKALNSRSIRANVKVFADFDAQRADADFAFRLNVNAVQAMEMLFR